MMPDRPEKKPNQLRCFCAKKPLLATYGVNKNKELYVHVRVYKQSRVFGEVLVTRGIVKLRCRDCFRWHEVRIVQPDRAVLMERTEPPELVENIISSRVDRPAPVS